jgi:hypothetical protein
VTQVLRRRAATPTEEIAMQKQQPIHDVKQDLKHDLKAFKHDVRALRDEVKLKLHLANMDLKDEWTKLEPQLEHAINSAAVVSGEVVADLKQRLTEFKQRLSKN